MSLCGGLALEKPAYLPKTCYNAKHRTGKVGECSVAPNLEIHRKATLLLISIMLVFSVSRTEAISIEMERSAVT